MSSLIRTLLALFVLEPVRACTNVLVTPAASDDGNPMIAYNADSGALQGMLYHYPPQNHTNDSSVVMRKVYSWDNGVYLGEIPESPVTYNVVGNTNEYGLVIAETTFGGVDILSSSENIQKAGKIDYGSLIYITLQRSKTCREAIKTMTTLMDKYGYASEGESFSLADREGEVWVMEVISRGRDKLGAVWVAIKIPDGMIAAHSNQARITTFPRNDPDNCLYADDVVSLAKEIGLYHPNPNDPEDLEFSFSDVYDPVTFSGARFSEARTWAIFSSLAKDNTFEKKYENYAKGEKLTNRMPLYIEPRSKLTFEDIISVMSNHYENTALSFDADIGAGPYNRPYRARPLTWSYNGVKYLNERSIATQQTGWNFIAEIRMDKPSIISSVLWFAVDDSSTSPRFPVYGSSRDVSAAYAGYGTQMGVASPLLKFDLQKAFWVQNMVANFVYSRWNDAYPFLQTKLAEVHQHFQRELERNDSELIELMAVCDVNDMKKIIDHATSFSVNAGDWLHKEWLDVYGEIFARYRDFYIVEEDKDDLVCNCKVTESGYSDEWKARIVQDTHDHYKMDGSVGPDVTIASFDEGFDTKNRLRSRFSTSRE